MKQFTVTQAEAGQRLDKFLGKYLNKAPKSFLYKMMPEKEHHPQRQEGRRQRKAGFRG